MSDGNKPVREHPVGQDAERWTFARCKERATLYGAPLDVHKLVRLVDGLLEAANQYRYGHLAKCGCSPCRRLREVCEGPVWPKGDPGH